MTRIKVITTVSRTGTPKTVAALKTLVSKFCSTFISYRQGPGPGNDLVVIYAALSVDQRLDHDGDIMARLNGQGGHLRIEIVWRHQVRHVLIVGLNGGDQRSRIV